MRARQRTSARGLTALAKRILGVASPLPGRGPYVNERPIHVPLRFCGQVVEVFLTKRFPHVDPRRWQRALAKGEIWWEGKRVALPQEEVSGGTTLIHRIPNTCEPPVNPKIVPVYEDEHLLVVAKPAPLPMHPCGRFSRNTLMHLLSLAMPETSLKIVHRLDADTSGVVVLAKHRDVARALVHQFEARSPRKVYRVGVWGQVSAGQSWARHDPISSASARAGTREVNGSGKDCRTEFRCLEARSRNHALLEARPQGGRTHQIRIHAACSGHPIVLDPAYGDLVALEGGLAQTPGRTLMLHAASISLRHPFDNSLCTWLAPLPAWAKTSTERQSWRDAKKASQRVGVT